MKLFTDTDAVYKLGESAHENWALLEMSHEDHYFFHLSSFSSCYVIVEPMGEPCISVIQKGALLCKQHTKYRHSADLKVDYCLCSNVIKGPKVGEAIFKSNRKVKQIKPLRYHGPPDVIGACDQLGVDL